MQWAAALALACAAAACGGDGTGPDGAGVPARLDVVAGDLQSATVGTELPQPLVVKVTDAKGKPVSGLVVNFVVTAGNGHVFAGAVQTNGSGEARERWTLGTVTGDTQKVEVRTVDAGNGDKVVFATFRAVATPGAPMAIAPVAPAPAGVAGQPLSDSIAAKVTDQYGNPVPGATVLWTVRAGGGSISPASNVTGPTGVARAAWTLGPSLDSAQVSEAAAGLTLRARFTSQAQLPLGATLVKRGGDAQTGTVGTTLATPLKVAVVLPGGVGVSGVRVVWTGAGHLSPDTAVTNAQGEATASWTLPTGAALVLASAQAQGMAGVTFTATAAAGAPAHLYASLDPPPGGPLTGAYVRTARVQVGDAYNNAVAGATVSWTPAAGSGTASPTSSVTDANGYATTQWTLASTPQVTQTLGISSGSVSTTVTDTRPYSAPTLQIVSGNNQSGLAGTTLAQPLVVRATHDGLPAAGVGVSWSYLVTSNLTNDSTVVTTSTTTDANGYTQLTFTLNRNPGTRTVTAATATSQVQFTVTGTTGTPHSLLMTGPGPQQGTAGVPLPDSLGVMVRDSAGHAVPGVTVYWSVQSGGGTVTASSVSDATGLARASWTPGSAAGVQSVTASLPGIAAASFYASVTPGPTVQDSVYVASGPEGPSLYGQGTVSTAGSGQYWFEVDTSSTFRNAHVQYSPYTGPVTVAQFLASPRSGTTYYVRFGAMDANGVTRGQVLSYTFP
jgi:hypothetical protein